MIEMTLMGATNQAIRIAKEIMELNDPIELCAADSGQALALVCEVLSNYDRAYTVRFHGRNDSIVIWDAIDKEELKKYSQRRHFALYRGDDQVIFPWSEQKETISIDMISTSAIVDELHRRHNKIYDYQVSVQVEMPDQGEFEFGFCTKSSEYLIETAFAQMRRDKFEYQIDKAQ